MILSEKERDQKTILSISNLCERLKTVEDAQTRLQILTSCQEAVISLGEKWESGSNKADAKGLKEFQIIQKLEEFCELVYQCSMEPNARIIASMKALLTEVSVSLDSLPRTYRVAFLPYKAAMWDSMETIWEAFKADERCEVSVVPIPYYEANRKTNQWEPHYEGELYPKEVPVTSYQEYLLEEKRPDLVFVHNPFDEFNYVTQVHPAFHSKELKKCCRKIAYVPYYVNPGFLSDDYKELPLLYRADYLIFQSDRMKDSCKGYPYYSRVLTYGSPKFDKIIRLSKEQVAPPPQWEMEMSGKKKLLLNTTITDLLTGGDVMLDKLRHFFEKVALRDDVVIVWRPHPLLEGTVKAMRPQFIEQYEDLVEYFNTHHVGVFDRTADSSRAVASTDAYIGSYYSAMIALFEVTGKPVFRFDSKNIYEPEKHPNRLRAKAEEVFRMNGPADFFGCTESLEYTFEDFVEDLVNGGLTQVLKNQMEAEADIANNLDGTSGQKIYEHLMGDLLKL